MGKQKKLDGFNLKYQFLNNFTRAVSTAHTSMQLME